MTSVVISSMAFAVGVFWHAAQLYGFWWGLAYAVFWQEWLGYRVALYLLGAS